jgi:ABC-2 type transport system permease protein
VQQTLLSIGTDTFLGLLAASVTAAVGLVVGVRAISRNIR